MMRTLKRSHRASLRMLPRTPWLSEPSGISSEIPNGLPWDDAHRLQTVCFTGHRFLPKGDIIPLVHRLDSVLDACYARGYRSFLCGGALGFDSLAAERVIELQKRREGVRLAFVLPCSDQVRYWGASDARRYERILYAADEIHVLSPFYYEGCMQVRNRHMVDRSHLCLCYLLHGKGGTASTVAYALEQEISVLNIAMKEACAAFVHSN